MKTLAEEWENFRTKTYPHGMTPDQERQMKQSFFAGAWCTLGQVKSTIHLPDDEGVMHLQNLSKECCATIEGMIKARVSRN